MARRPDQEAELVERLGRELLEPLTVIVGYAELLQDDLGPRLTPNERVFVEAIARNVGVLRERVEALLDEAR